MPSYFFGPQAPNTGLSVMKTPAGWYVGEWQFNEEMGFQEPYSRNSEYFATQAEAQELLDTFERLNNPDEGMDDWPSPNSYEAKNNLV
jgi:hypothetical protein